MKTILNLLTVLTLVSMTTGIAVAQQTAPSVPDAGTTASLMALALGGLAAVRRFVR